MAVNTIGYFPPSFKINGIVYNPATDSQPLHAGDTVVAGDILIFTSGTVGPAATDAHANIAGIAFHGSGQVYQTANASVSPSTLFGYNLAGGGLQGSGSAEVGNIHFGKLYGSQLVEMSLLQATTFAQALVGTTAGILLTGGNYVVDNTQGDAAVEIVGLVQGPGQQTLGNTGGGRVIVKFLDSVLADF